MNDLELLDLADPVIVDCLRFCFIGLIRAELKDLIEEWNQHIISKSINGGPSGRPDTMFFLPHLYDCQNFLEPVEEGMISDFLPAVENLPLDYTPEFKEFAETIMEEGGLEMPVNAMEGLNLFLYMLDKIAEHS